MIFRKQKEQLLATVYQPIEKEYDDIQRESAQLGNNTDFPFAEFVGRSKSFAYHHPYFALLNKRLNCLAHEWDSTLLENRKGKDQTSTELLKPSHCFLLVPNKHIASASAKLYDKAMPPDHRLVAISISGVTQQSLACIYHEMGHFIGFRNRQARLTDYFIPVLIDKLLTLIYEMTCRHHISGVPAQSKHIASYTRYSEDQEYNINVRSYASQMIRCLQAIRKDMLYRVTKEYQAFTNTLPNCTKEEKQLALSVKMGYFASVHGLMTRTLVKVLSCKENLQRWNELISQRLAGQESPYANDQWLHISTAITIVVAELNECIKTYTLPLWYEECEQYLEEPAADVFMLKMIGFSCQEYIELIIKQLQNVIGSTSIERIERAIDKPSIHQRVIGIAMALNAQSSDFVNVGRPDGKIDDAEYQQKRAAQKRLLSMYQCARKISELPEAAVGDFFDPTPYLFKYVDELWHDQRYAEFAQKHKMLLDSVRDCVLLSSKFGTNLRAWKDLATN